MFIRYCIAQYKAKQKKLVYQYYITDALMCMCNNTSHSVSGGSMMNKRYSEIIAGMGNGKPETAEEIIAGVTERAGLKVIRNNGPV